jgi:DNA-binding NtrC family response regulator
MNKGNLLVVDDEKMIVEHVALLLEDNADNIFTAYNGIEALEVLDKEVVHCVICDINMPKMNGVELIKEIRKKNNQIPFIFYTAHGNEKLMLEAVKYGAFDFLNKPNLEGLEEVVIKGLKEGFSPQSKEDSATSTFISEYKKMIQKI